MKKQIDLQLIASLIGGVIFNYLFWMERLALNLLLYSLFITVMLLFNKEIIKSKKFILYNSLHLLSALLVVFNNSDLTVIGYYFSLAIFIGFAHVQLIRSIFTAILAAFLQIVSSPVNLVKRLAMVKVGHSSIAPILKKIKYIVIPIVVIFLFSIIYSIANPVFAKYIALIATNIGNFISNVFTFIFGDLSVARFLHVILGILLTAGILIGFKDKSLQNAELTLTEKLIRKRKHKPLPSFGTELKNIFSGSLVSKKMALKTENIIGIISFTALNLLLLFLNAIDVSTLWLGKLDNLAGKNYSAELHEGTNALIFSIVMAMMVILYFFSGNINFFSKNKTIRLLAYIWIIQNAFLVSSVLLRDYNYIDMHGLTYKRIGVIVFLILCTVGLCTVYIKVAKQKTFFYLCKINGFVWYVLLLVFSFINWDVFIVSYNINNRKSIALDLDHLMDMSDKTLPLLDKNRTLLAQYLPQSNYYYYTETAVVVPDTTAATKPVDSTQLNKKIKQSRINEFNKDLDHRILKFEKKWNNTSWLSWNYRDWQTE